MTLLAWAILMTAQVEAAAKRNLFDGPLIETQVIQQAPTPDELIRQVGAPRRK